MSNLNKEEALTILQSIGLLVDSHLRECDAVYGSQDLLEEVEALSDHVDAIFKKVFLTM